MPQKSLWQSFSAVGGAALVIGSFIYAIVAQATQPPLPPADTIIEWQALWNDGYYGQKYTFAVTWIGLAVAFISPFLLVHFVRVAIRSLHQSRPLSTEWNGRPLAQLPTRRAAMFALGLAMCIIGYGFLGVCLVDPTVLVPIGFIARLLLAVCPLFLVAGPAMVVDCLPACVIVGTVEGLRQVAPQGAGQAPSFRFSVRDHHFTLEERVWSQLTPNERVAVTFSPVFRRVLGIVVDRG
jgi:hypothetical protein